MRTPLTKAPSSARRRTAVLVCLLALGLVVLASIALGSKNLGLATVVDALIHGGSGQPGDPARIVIDLRLPRTAAGLVVGASLGLAGAVIQALTRNPLGDPGLLGVNAGAGAAVVLAVVFLGTTSTVQDLGFALVGALVITVVVALIGSARGVADPVRLTLAGVAIAAVLTGITEALSLTHPRAFDRLRGWNAGTLVERDWDVILPVLPLLGAGIAIALSIARALDASALGDDVAAGLGVDVRRTRVLAIVAITLLAGVGTAIAGPIVFVGLMVPHVARWAAGPDQRWVLPLSLLLGAILVLCADVLGRILLPTEIPAGVITAFVGAPLLIAIVRRARVMAL